MASWNKIIFLLFVFVLIYLEHQLHVEAKGDMILMPKGGPMIIKSGGKKNKKHGDMILMGHGGHGHGPMIIKSGGKKDKHGDMILMGHGGHGPMIIKSGGKKKKHGDL